MSATGSPGPRPTPRVDELRRFVGQTIMRAPLVVEAGKVAEFARALHDPNPVYRDRDAAARAGFANVPAPPTFTAVLAHFPLDAMQTASAAGAVVAALGLNRERTLNGSQRWTYARTPMVGDELVATVRVSSVESRRGSSGRESTTITAATEYRDPAGDLVLTETVTLVELAASAP